MIYLIPNWKQENFIMNSDRILEIAELYHDGNVAYQLILTNYMPFLRYKLENRTVNYWQVFDKLQNIALIEGHPMTIDDLVFPNSAEFIYTPFGVSVLNHQELFAEIILNEFGCLSKVKYYQKNGYYTDYYDDRGFLSSRFYYQHNELVKREFFNEYQELALTELLGNHSKVIIEKGGIQSLSKSSYPNLNAVIAELLDYKLAADDRETNVVTVIDRNVLNITRQLQNVFPLVRIIPDDFKLTNYQQDELIEIIDSSKAVITDTSRMKNDLEEIQKNHLELAQSKIHLIPMYRAELNLGISNFVDEMVIYWRIEQLTQFIYQFNDLLIDRLINDDSYRLILSLKTFQDKEILQDRIRNLIDSYYDVDSQSADYKKIEKFIQDKKNKKLLKTDEDAIEPLRSGEKWSDFVTAVHLYHRIEYRVNSELYQIKDDLRISRLYIDVNVKQDLQLQLVALTTGIPQILSNPSDYIINPTNGIVLNAALTLEETVEYFLNNLNHWNLALVKNIELLEAFESDKIIEKWRRVFYEEAD